MPPCMTIRQDRSSARSGRRDHLAALRSRGRDPFAQTRYDVDATAAELNERTVPRERSERGSRELAVAGRIMTKRTMADDLRDLHDRTGACNST